MVLLLVPVAKQIDLAPAVYGTDVSFDRIADAASDAGLVLDGDRSSRITLVMFVDFLCPACRDSEAKYDRLLANGVGIRRIVVPFPLHQDAREACQATFAADRLGFGNTLYRTLMNSSPSEWKHDVLACLKANSTTEAEFTNSMSLGDAKLRLAEALAKRLQVRATPTVLIVDEQDKVLRATSWVRGAEFLSSKGLFRRGELASAGFPVSR